MYKLLKNSPITNKPAKFIVRLDDNAQLGISLDNTDYQRFKQDIAAGAELQDADGNVMTPDQIQAFIATLP